MTAATTTPPAPERAALAAYLTGMLRRAGLTWAELAQATQRSVSTLQRTARPAGAVPPEANVAVFVRGCGHGKEAEQEAFRLWRRARIEQRGILPGLDAPPLDYARNRGDLLAAAAVAYEKAGAPSLRAVQQRGGGIGKAFVLPVTAAWRIVNLRRLPGDVRQFEAFLRGCGVTQKALAGWREAWQRVTAAQPADGGTAATASVRRGRAEDKARVAASKISPQFERLLRSLSAEDVETVLTVGAAYLVAEESQRNGTTVPTDFDHVFRVSREVFGADRRLVRRHEGQLPPERFLEPSPGLPSGLGPPCGPPVDRSDRTGADIVYTAGAGQLTMIESKRYGDNGGRPDSDAAPAPLPSGPGSGGRPGSRPHAASALTV
ncbi:hypothetical protein [Streptomyces sp. NPDC005407]|uniref:hypothetical protein n=1 Tax=Streptomyces sp. NPDC005407 TaxID=3155340 RepID=UPI0033A475A1